MIDLVIPFWSFFIAFMFFGVFFSNKSPWNGMGIDYGEKLTEIIRENDIQSVTIVRMEVPCCGGLEMAAKKALQASGKFIPWQVVTVAIDGKILDR